MDTEFHYWMTGIIAKAAGFEESEAKTIAYASEYVDENDRSIKVLDRSNGEVYENFISQTMNILKPKSELMRIYPIFHFLPGDPQADIARRRDGKMHILNTTPNNENANKLMDEAFGADEELRLYRIGIATHAFADTWAHQNFVGWYDYFNNIGLDVKPDIGHADGEHHPDWPAHRWVDERLVDAQLDNRHRFLSAAEAIFKRYCAYQASINREDKSAELEALETRLDDAMGKGFTGSENFYKEERIEKYKALLGDGWEDFDEMVWFDEAIETEVRGLRDPGDGLTALFTLFHDKYYWKEGLDKRATEWFRFQTSVKAHEMKAVEILAPTFARMGITLGNA